MSSLHPPSRLFILLSLVVLLSVFTVSSTCPQAGGLQGPFVSNITSNSAVIWWSGSKTVPGRVVVKEHIFEDHEPPFEVVVSDLKPGKPYPYYVEFGDGRRRPSEGGSPFLPFPDRYHNGTVFCSVLTGSQTGCQAYRRCCRVHSSGSVPYMMLQRAKTRIDLIQKRYPLTA